MCVVSQHLLLPACCLLSAVISCTKKEGKQVVISAILSVAFLHQKGRKPGSNFCKKRYPPMCVSPDSFWLTSVSQLLARLCGRLAGAEWVVIRRCPLCALVESYQVIQWRGTGLLFHRSHSRVSPSLPLPRHHRILHYNVNLKNNIEIDTYILWIYITCSRQCRVYFF